MGKKRKRVKKLKSIICIFMCAFMFFGTAEPLSVSAASPPVSNDTGLQEKYDMSSPAGEQTDSVQNDENVAVQSDENGIIVIPLLNMPHRAYEGHSVIMSDASGYRIDGEAADIKDVYANGIAWVEFAVQDEEQSEHVTIRDRKSVV